MQLTSARLPDQTTIAPIVYLCIYCTYIEYGQLSGTIRVSCVHLYMSGSGCGVLDSSWPRVGSLNIYAYDLSLCPVSYAAVRLDVVVASMAMRKTRDVSFLDRGLLDAVRKFTVEPLLLVGIANEECAQSNIELDVCHFLAPPLQLLEYPIPTASYVLF